MNHISATSFSNIIDTISFITGIPGIGKTRLGQDIFNTNLIENVPSDQVLRLYISFNDYLSLCNADKYLIQNSRDQLIIIARIIFSLYRDKFNAVEFESFLKILCTIVDQTLYEVLKELATLLNVKVIYLFVDELNLVYDYCKTYEIPKTLIKCITRIWSTRSSPFFIVPLFSSMIEQVILEAIVPTGCSANKLPVHLLTSKQCMEIKASVFTTCTPSLERTLQQVIRDSGGHLRTLETFFKELYTNPDISQPELFKRVTVILYEKYNSSILADKEILSTIIRYALLQKKNKSKEYYFTEQYLYLGILTR